jgi:hypothetical protein
MTKHGLPMAWLKEHLSYEADDCVAWPFTKTTQGYARVWHNGKMYPAYRLMCELANGAPATQFLDAAHSCGNGHLGCMNPKHLRWATKSENQMDRVKHGTSNRGERCAAAKLTALDVEAIREMAPFVVHARLCEFYGISAAQISRIVNGTRWAA